jgi:hypothetical protein
MHVVNGSNRYDSGEQRPQWLRDVAWVKRFASDYLLSRPGTPRLDRWIWQLVARVTKGAQVVPPSGVNPYLLRVFTMVGRRKTFGKVWRMHLNHFFRSDSDRELHNHPWEVSYSLILTGGYTEHYLDEKTGRVETRKLRPGSFNVIRRDHFHRVELLDSENGCWTLFVTVNRVQEKFGYEWGFKDTTTGEYTPWGEYLPPAEMR